MSACPQCGAPLECPLGCGACGALLAPVPSPTPFEVFGLEPSFALDTQALKQRLLKLSRLVHPDYFGAADAATRARAEGNTAALNAAHATLADPGARGDWLVRALGGPSESERREMPKAFLMDVLEWNETLEAARAAAPASSARAALDGLERTLHTQRDQILAALARLLTPPPAPGAPALADARAQLNALRYLDRTLEQAGALRVDHATSSPTN